MKQVGELGERRNFISQFYWFIENIISVHKLKISTQSVKLCFYQALEKKRILHCAIFITGYDNPTTISVNPEDSNEAILAKLEAILLTADKHILDEMHKAFLHLSCCDRQVRANP